MKKTPKTLTEKLRTLEEKLKPYQFTTALIINITGAFIGAFASVALTMALVDKANSTNVPTPEVKVNSRNIPKQEVNPIFKIDK
jgi:hypothetical protein